MRAACSALELGLAAMAVQLSTGQSLPKLIRTPLCSTPWKKCSPRVPA